MSYNAEYQRLWRLKNPEKVKAYSENNGDNYKRWVGKNYDRQRANIKKWQQEHKVEHRLWKQARRAIAKGVMIDKMAIHNWQSRVCGICDLLIKEEFHIDHIIPLSRRGKHEVTNLQLAHPRCNGLKYNKLPSEFDRQSLTANMIVRE